jgi:hypothetical protein
MDAVIQWLQDTGIVMLNGLLTVLYFVWEQGPTVVSLAIAAMVMVWPDRSVQKVAGHRPRRRQRGAVVKATPLAMLATAATAAIWAVASYLSRAPVTLWGTALWLGLLVGSLVLVQERENVLWTHKGMIVGYAALAVLLRLLFQNPVDVQGWSDLMGIDQGGEMLWSSVRQSLAPWAAVIVWGMYPVFSLGVLGQRLYINRLRLISPFTSVRQVIANVRTRGEN